MFDDDELTDAQRATLAERIRAIQTELRQTIDDAEQLAGTVELDQAAMGRVSRIDALQQQEMAKAAVLRNRIRLDRLSEAAQRLVNDPESAGLCVECGELIRWKRLLAYPESRSCVACADGR